MCISNLKNFFPGVIPPDPHDKGGEGKKGRARKRRARERRGRDGRGEEGREGWDGVNPLKTNSGYDPGHRYC
jgi:hypothetical protein